MTNTTTPPSTWHNDPDIGKISDTIIAQRYGVTRAAVALFRKKHSITAAGASRLGAAREAESAARRDAALRMLRSNPQATEREVSESCGVARDTVRTLRKQLNSTEPTE